MTLVSSNRSPLVKYATLHIFTCTLHLYITNSLSSQFPVGFIAQLAERCTSVAVRSWVRITFRPEFCSGFFRLKLFIKLPQSIMSSYPSRQLKYMIFHILTNIRVSSQAFFILLHFLQTHTGEVK